MGADKVYPEAVTRDRAGRRRGLSFIELLLSLGVTGLVGAGVAMMLVAVSYGTTTDTEMRGAVVRHKTVGGRIDAAVRSSILVVAKGDNFIVLWIAAIKHPDHPHLSEVRRIDFDPLTGEIISYKAPDDLSDEDDERFNREQPQEIASRTNELKGTARFPGAIWATGVAEWGITLDQSVARNATQVAHRLRFAGSPDQPAVAAAALRHRWR